MRYVLAVVSMVLGAVVVAVGVSLVWAIVASWCLVGLCACLTLAGVVLPCTVQWSWWLVLALWLLGIMISLLFNGLRVRVED